MPAPTNGSIIAAIRDMLKPISEDLNELRRSLPATYVTIRAHDQDIHTLNEKMTDAQARISALEKSRIDSTQWANDEHNELRESYQKDAKQQTDSLNAISKQVTILTTRFDFLFKCIGWFLGIFGVVIASLITAFLTHLIHF